MYAKALYTVSHKKGREGGRKKVKTFPPSIPGYTPGRGPTVWSCAPDRVP